MARLLAFASLMSAGVAVYAAVQLRMFVGRLRLSGTPPALLRTPRHVARRGRLGRHSLRFCLSFAWVRIGSPLVLALRDRERRLPAGLALLTLATVLTTSGAPIWYNAGEKSARSVPGRDPSAVGRLFSRGPRRHGPDVTRMVPVPCAGILRPVRRPAGAAARVRNLLLQIFKLYCLYHRTR